MIAGLSNSLNFNRLARMQQAVVSFSEERQIQLPEEIPEAYVEWGAPSNFDIDDVIDPTKKTKPYVLSGDYYEEAREYRDEFVTQSSGGLNHFARAIKSIAFRGKYGEQVVMTFSPQEYEVQHANSEGLDPYEYSMTIGDGGKFIRHLNHEGDTVPATLPQDTPFQWYRDFVNFTITEL